MLQQWDPIRSPAHTALSSSFPWPPPLGPLPPASAIAPAARRAAPCASGVPGGAAFHESLPAGAGNLIPPPPRRPQARLMHPPLPAAAFGPQSRRRGRVRRDAADERRLLVLAPSPAAVCEGHNDVFASIQYVCQRPSHAHTAIIEIAGRRTPACVPSALTAVTGTRPPQAASSVLSGGRRPCCSAPRVAR